MLPCTYCHEWHVCMPAVIGTAAGVREPCGVTCVVPPITCSIHDVPGSAVAWYVRLTRLSQSRTPHTNCTASVAHTPPGPLALPRARPALKVARCGGLPLIRCGAATPHNAALAAVNGCAQRSPGSARRRTPLLPHHPNWETGRGKCAGSGTAPARTRLGRSRSRVAAPSG